jgi:hypothetical protein
VPITTDKKTANAYDVVVRTGKFPLQGKKVVLTKGTTKISFPISDLYDAINALEDIAHSVDGTTSGFRAP